MKWEDIKRLNIAAPQPAFNPNKHVMMTHPFNRARRRASRETNTLFKPKALKVYRTPQEEN